MAAEAFRLEKDKVSGQVPSGQGLAFIGVKEIVPAALPPLADVRERVNRRVIEIKATALAADKAKAMAAAGKGNFAGAAKAAGVPVRTTELIARGATLPDVGISEKVDAIAFKLAKGETSEPIEVGSTVVVVHVKDRQAVDPAARDAARDGLRGELSQQRRGAFFSAYLAKAMEKMDIQYNTDTLKKIIGE